MKFRRTTSEPPALIDMGVISMGRFGNYFMVHGWYDGAADELPGALYRFAGCEPASKPEFTYVRDMENGRIRFLQLFWVNDGYKLVASPDQPVHLSLHNTAGQPLAHPVSLHDFWHHEFEPFLEALEAIANRDVWTNRIIWEMIKRCGVDHRLGFFKLALDRIGWQTLDAGVEKNLAESAGPDSLRENLDFQCLCIFNMDVGYLPSELRAKFIGLIGQFRIEEKDRQLVQDAVRQLARIDPELACDFALRVINTLEFDRKEMAVCLRPCFPQNSQWWLHHALNEEELGTEQAADALNCAGTAASTQGLPSLALLSFEAALKIDPQAQSVAWNAGWHCAANGDFGKAVELFKNITRHYTQHSLATRWPHVNDLPWPLAAMGTEGFTLPDGIQSWPRITVVTPSFNQGCFIEETLLSVLNQGYPNLQYIVVDGNSTDETREVLERYRDRLDHLIIESDKGQTEAINKGLRLADGDLVAWVNSDDMYAPGTLHQAALKWLENQADVIAGICIEHIGRHMLLFNKPAATNADFNPSQLARIFKYWLKGFYFYQPEVFFSKRILDTVGLLNESLYYSMDYDLWMRFAKAGATMETVDWPFAFFRKHAAQKTSNLVDCIEEQARVRTRHHPLVPDEERGYRIRRNLDLLKRKQGASIGILTKRLNKIFSASMQAELDRFCDKGFSYFLSDDESDPRIARADAVILLAHVQEDTKTVDSLRAANKDRLIAAWFWDNHHHLFENQKLADIVDIVLPGHALYGEYLRNDQSIHGGHVPLCITQWARQDVAEWFGEFGAGQRSPELYGGFVEYTFEPARTEFLHKLMDLLPKHSLSILSEANLHAYFGRSEKERFAEWCRYQTSLILPLRNDLSQRVFDALLAGLIPLVPEEIKDLDLVISPELQESLPIVRFRMKDPGSAVAAHRQASEAFARMGAAGALARHRHALENHMFSSRINSIIELMEVTATQS
jgi:glycosyltransferase involved in cell wall biosynthesis